MSRDRDDRPSWREIDRRRESGQSGAERRPRGPHAEERNRQATQQYLKEVDRLFSDGRGGAEGDKLAAAVREAHGTPALADACRAYRDAVGMPATPDLLGIFLDSDDRELVVGALEALLELHRSGRLEASRGLKSQVRTLAQGFDDEIAEAAEELAEAI